MVRAGSDETLCLTPACLAARKVKQAREGERGGGGWVTQPVFLDTRAWLSADF